MISSPTNTQDFPSIHKNINQNDASVMSVFEHQRLTVHDFMQSSDFAWLLAQEFAVFTIKRQRGQWQLKVGHYIGIIILPSSMTLEILPKSIASAGENSSSQYDDILRTRQWVQRMLTDLTSGVGANIGSNKSKLPHSKNLGQFSHQLAPLLQQTLPLSQWLITQFLQLLSGYQPSKHYQTQTCNQSMLQGKLLIKEQLRRNGMQPHKFVSEVSVLNQEMLSNRLIKSALLLLEPLSSKSLLPKSLLPWQQVTALSQYELSQLTPLYLTAKRQLNTQPLARQQHQTAQQLLDLSYWLLQGQHARAPTGNSLSHQTLSNASSPQLRLCLLINMNQAFEQWASACVAAAFNEGAPHRPLYQTLSQPRDVWLRDEAGQVCLSMQPDLLIYRLAVEDGMTDKNHANQAIGNAVAHSRHCSHVIDIKWKHLAHATAISASDAYQLTSYAQAYQAEQVWLIYPVTDRARRPIALRQLVHSSGPNRAELWLMPFNVLTGALNS